MALPPDAEGAGLGTSSATADRKTFAVDVAVRLPPGLLQARDFLDNRYFLKRGLYLHALRRALVSNTKARRQLTRELGCTKPEGAVVFWPWRDPRKPCLELRCNPPGMLRGVALRLVLRPCIAADNFPPAKLRPDRCNLRLAPAAPWGALLDWRPKGGVRAAPPAVSGESTPLYSHAVLEDALLEAHSDFLAATAAATGNGCLLGEAAALLKIWARAQFVGAAAGGPGGFELTALVADALRANPLLAVEAPLDVARSVLQRLAGPAFAEGGRMQEEEAGPCGGEPGGGDEGGGGSSGSGDPAERLQQLEAFRNQFPGGFVLLDPWGRANVLARARPAALQRLADAAGRASRSLKSALSPAGELGGGGAALHAVFDALFHHRLSFGSAFDFTFQVLLPGPKAPPPAGAAEAARAGPAWAEDHCRAELEEARVEDIVRLALGERAAFVCALPRGAAGPRATAEPVRVGVLADPEHLATATDIGPDGTERESCRLFRRFWGDLSQLRRFRDGRIAEAVAWGDVPGAPKLPAERALGSLVPLAATAALERHFRGASVTHLAAPLWNVGDGAAARQRGVLWDGLAAEAALGRACEEFGQLLRRLESLPLRVAGFRGLDAALRRTDPFPPEVHPLATGGFEAAPQGSNSNRARPPLCVRPVAVRAALEGSGRWPRDPAALAKTRASFQLRLAAVLHADFGLKAVATEDFLDVFFRGFIFRLELDTLEEAPGAGGSSRKRARGEEEAGGAGGHEARREGGDMADAGFLTGAAHDAIAALAGLAPSFPGATKLAKLWVGMHMLGEAIPDAAVELACAAVYVGDGAAGRRPPASAHAGFLRFLQIVAEHPWAHRPLLVPLVSGGRAATNAESGGLGASEGGAPPPVSTSSPGDGEASQTARREALDAFDRGGRPMGLAALGVGSPSAPPVFVADGVSALGLRRLQLAAGHALGLLLRACSVAPGACPSKDVADGTALVSRAFAPSAEGFDALIPLHEGAVPDRAHEGAGLGAPKALSGRLVRGALRNAGSAPAVKLGRVPRAVLEHRSLDFAQEALLVGLDPGAAFVAALRTRFGALAEFFRNTRGGTVVGVCWRPGAFLVADEADGGAPGAAGLPRVSWECPTSGRRRGVPDAAAVLADMAALGAGLAAAPGLCESPRAAPPAALRLRK